MSWIAQRGGQLLLFVDPGEPSLFTNGYYYYIAEEKLKQLRDSVLWSFLRDILTYSPFFHRLRSARFEKKRFGTQAFKWLKKWWKNSEIAVEQDAITETEDVRCFPLSGISSSKWIKVPFFSSVVQWPSSLSLCCSFFSLVLLIREMRFPMEFTLRSDSSPMWVSVKYLLVFILFSKRNNEIWTRIFSCYSRWIRHKLPPFLSFETQPIEIYWWEERNDQVYLSFEIYELYFLLR